MNDSDSLRWLEIFGYGFLIWIMEIMTRVALYSVQGYSDRAMVVILLVGITVASISAILYLPKCSGDRRTEGIALAFAWLVLVLGLDILVFSSRMGRSLGYADFSWDSYVLSEGWIYIYLLIVGICGGFLSHYSDAAARKAETDAKRSA